MTETDEAARRHAREDREREDQRKRERNVLWGFWSTLGGGILSIGLFAAGSAPGRGWTVLGLALLAGGAAALVGAVLGFLFGLPRSVPEPAPAPASGASATEGGTPSAPPANGARALGPVNNNLLEISDWLTKIIVGAGLVELKALVQWVGGVGRVVGAAASLDPSLAPVFGCSVLTFFFAWGFLFVYIQTRTIISFIFATTDRLLQNLGTTIREAVATEVRQSVLPQIDRVSENTIFQLLYNNQPGAAKAAEERAREFLQAPGNQNNGRVLLYLACAYGQQHAAAQDAAVRQALADKALDALQEALAADPALRGLARGLLYPTAPEHIAGDNDLETLNGDPRFQQLVGPPPA
jgi:hypothetical protein